VKKAIVSSLTATSLLFSNGAFSDAGPEAEASSQLIAQSQEVITEATTDETTPLADADVQPASQESEVGVGNDDAAKAAKRRQWGNIALAVGAVVVATVALLLVANNQGHKG
jgi:hypothetical protein